MKHIPIAAMLAVVGSTVTNLAAAQGFGQFSADLSTSTISDPIFVTGSTPGRIASATANSIDFIGTTGPLALGSSEAASTTTLALPSIPKLGVDPGPLPANESEYIGNSFSGSVSKDKTVNLAVYYARDPVNYRANVARAFAMPVAEVPTIQRMTYGDQVIGSAFFRDTDYAYIGNTFNYVSTTSFDLTWNINDAPGTHQLLTDTGYYMGSTLLTQSGHYTLNGNVDGFTIRNADNFGGPAEVTISNLIYTGIQGSFGTISSSQFYQQIDFVASVGPIGPVPEPGSHLLMLAGLGALGAVATRRQRRRPTQAV